MRTLIATTLLCLAGPVAAAPSPPACPAEEGREVRAFGGEIAGDHDYREALGNGWTFVLAHDPFGWNLRVLDAAGMDLTQLTPPYRFAPNPREIFGWHFRNADNTGANEGSVNAPQRLRVFSISPGVSGTGGFKPSTDAPVDVEAQASEGRGSLFVLDYGLTDLDPARQARMVYLKFAACLSWPAAAAQTVSAAATNAEDVERFAACGLGVSYVLDPYLSPPMHDADFDGDGVLDSVAPIARTSDGKRGLAFCLAGSKLHVIGIEGDLGELTPAYFDRMDYWRVDARTSEPFSPVGGDPPVLRGDAITIGMEEKSSVLLYWDGDRFRSYWQGD